MRFVLLTFVLISLIFEKICLNRTHELRSLVFVAFVFVMLGIFGMSEWWRNGMQWKLKFKFTAIDWAYVSCIFLTVVSLVVVAKNVVTFHYAFVTTEMFAVYIFCRATFSHREKKLNSFQFFQSPSISQAWQIFKKQWLTFLVVFIGFVNAVIGVIQFFYINEVVGTFARTSYFGCFLAINAPLAFCLVLEYWGKSRLRYSVIGMRYLAAFSWLAFIVILVVTVLTKSRTAIIGLGAVLSAMILATKSQMKLDVLSSTRLKETLNKKKRKSNFDLCLRVLVAVFFIIVIVFFGAKTLYKTKPMSASGRTLIWKVSAEMFLKNPISGVGFGNFANKYNLYQADFFATGKGSVVNKMTAGRIRHAYNWYLETAAELGIFGLVVFGIFWWLILVEVYKVFFCAKSRSCKEESEYFLNIGMAGSVLCFMIMCLFQFPNKIIPTYLIFNVALAWIVNANLEENSKNQITPQHMRGKNNK